MKKCKKCGEIMDDLQIICEKCSSTEFIEIKKEEKKKKEK